jgi:DNA gyrase/topoisomerase IV subunit A
MKVTKKKVNIDSHIINKKNNKIIRDITEFLNTDYRDYVKYVIETRALPNLLDGFKVGARKILHSAFHGGLKNGNECKLLNLTGDVYNLTLYLHGDASLNSTMITLGSEFKDNLNPLTIIGQHGSLRDEKSISAPRYLYVKLSPWSKLYKIDEDLLEYVFDEGQYLEPKNYWPIIPTVLTSRSEGMAPGYKFSSFSYNPLDIIDACLEILKTNKLTKTIIRPYVRGILNERFTYDKEVNKWLNSGVYKTDMKNDILEITDLPYDMGYDKFEKRLNELVEKNIIKEWQNFSQDNNLNYKLYFYKSSLKNELSGDKKEKLFKKLGLFTYIPDDLLYVIDENGKVKHFINKEQLIEYFVKIRLNKYNDRKNKLVSVMEKRYEDNNNICKFIELVSSGEIIITNRKTKEIKTDLKKYNLPDSVLSIQISKLTEEEKKEILKKNKEIEKELKYIKKTTIKDMYINDLKELKKEIESEF